MNTHVHTIPGGKMVVTWDADARAIIDTWANYGITLEQFREAVLVKGLDHSRAHGGRAWIVDSSQAKGAFSQEIQAFIDSDIFPAFAANGVKYFITINSPSVVTQLTIQSYQAKTGPNGLILVEVLSMQDALAWLKDRD